MQLNLFTLYFRQVNIRMVLILLETNGFLILTKKTWRIRLNLFQINLIKLPKTI